MNNPRVLLVIGLVVLLLLAAIVVVVGRALQARVTGGSESRQRRARPARDWAVTPLPTGLARTLTERGLVNAQQLASMSAAEREFFVATVATRVGEGSRPKLVGDRPGNGHAPTAPATGAVPAPGNGYTGATGGSAMPAPLGAASDGGPAAADLTTTAALVSGGIHCPVCRGPLAQRSETPLLMSRCPGCGRRVGVRVEGNRLTVTVQYGAPTPAAGTPVARDASRR
jgi:hypothetical protein